MEREPPPLEGEGGWDPPESVFPWDEFIEEDSGILLGKPVIKGTRLSVEFVLDLFAAGWSEQQVLDNYPRLSLEAVRAAFAFAADRLRDQSGMQRDLAAR